MGSWGVKSPGAVDTSSSLVKWRRGEGSLLWSERCEKGPSVCGGLCGKMMQLLLRSRSQDWRTWTDSFQAWSNFAFPPDLGISLPFSWVTSFRHRRDSAPIVLFQSGRGWGLEGLPLPYRAWPTAQVLIAQNKEKAGFKYNYSTFPGLSRSIYLAETQTQVHRYTHRN